ncbi:hypothetical protein [Azonexus sp.]|jgi:uncharacterized membrane protein YfcA|uniref:hypothetical protein n=1 Tax=Azonexus sp. TaxID=1872668 RepID=UPI002825744B|nr:hypothetical protein [Azonexus sp.]MDR1994011.1 hypothetical protein [Azonexus sp.]
MNTPSAKSIIVSIVTIVLGFSVLSWFPTPEAKDIGRFVVNCVLCWFLFKGKNWARWVLAVFLTLGGTMGIFFVVAAPQYIEKNIFIYAISFFYLASAALLVFSRTVASYFSGSTVQANS